MREPKAEETYTTKENEEVVVKYYSKEKKVVTYIHNGNQYTKRLNWFVNMLAKWSR